jgi:hypothetical protein
VCREYVADMDYKEWLNETELTANKMVTFQKSYKCNKPECEGDDYCIHLRKAKTRKFKKEIIRMLADLIR